MNWILLIFSLLLLFACSHASQSYTAPFSTNIYWQMTTGIVQTGFMSGNDWFELTDHGDIHSSAYQVVGTGGSNSALLSVGDTVGPSSSFVSYYYAGTTSYGGPFSTNNVPGYLGLKFTFGGQTYYGWIQLVFTSSTKTILSFGYNPNPGAAVTVGAGLITLTGEICVETKSCSAPSSCVNVNNAPSGTVCLPGSGFCNPDDTCDGTGSCITNSTPDGTTCTASSPCAYAACSSGTCLIQTSVGSPSLDEVVYMYEEFDITWTPPVCSQNYNFYVENLSSIRYLIATLSTDSGNWTWQPHDLYPDKYRVVIQDSTGLESYSNYFCLVASSESAIPGNC